MTRVCLIGDDDCNLQYELLSRETSRDALATYDLERPFANSLAVRTVSIGAAISLLNDLQWYLTRFVEEALVLEPSISDDEWLSRPLAERLRNGDADPAETREFYKVYGLERESGESDGTSGDSKAAAAEANSRAAGDDDSSPPTDEEPAQPGDDGGQTQPAAGRPRLVEPLYVRRTGGELPAYDLRDVSETLVVRVTESEYASAP
ncbi:hypothetical protein D8Y22_10020 [Salinadaptatus halalkaliphilus]|uniref:Uncharacterized protein n=1 Tax=Salinadaptatus halalkaliphilus TaxID=2419781 RepID=A0A4S3TNY9_9EURY|nr:DUF5804 family protein [Salinadaptatus halalkaliphilus]THE64943.1 hypothetical protein D8Y22_10020 [Salinadaptatus halalkaliphilus]